MAMKCPQCSGQILDSQRFCRFCGYRLDQGVQDYTSTVVLDQPASMTGPALGYGSPPAPWMPPAYGTTAPPIRRSRCRRRVVIALMVFAAFGVAGRVAQEGIRSGWFDRSRFEQIAPGIAGPSTAALGLAFDDAERGGAFIDRLGSVGGPAETAGLVGGDLIVQADDRPIKSTDDLRRFLRSKAPGDLIRLKVLRDGKPLALEITAASKDDLADEPPKPWGFFGIDEGEATRVRIPGTPIYGVRMDSLIRNRPADLAGIRNGDIIVEFGGHPIRTYREFIRQIRVEGPRADVDVKLIRDGQEMVIPLRLGEP